MMLKVIPIDKANHAVYGAVAGALAAVAGVGLGAPLAAAALCAPAAAWLAGWGKEQLDRRANEEAAERGEPAPHSVEQADIMATVAGGVLPGLPLLVASMATWVG